MCLIDSGDWHPIHSGVGSSLSRKACVSHEWPIWLQLRMTWSCRHPHKPVEVFPIHGSMPCRLLILSSHMCCHLALMCVAISGFRSQWGIRHGSTSQFRAFFTAWSLRSFPRMPAWPGTQHRWVSYPSVASWFILKVTFAMNGWSVFSPATAYRQEKDRYRQHHLCSQSRQCTPMRDKMFELPLLKLNSDQKF